MDEVNEGLQDYRNEEYQDDSRKFIVHTTKETRSSYFKEVFYVFVNLIST